MNSLYCWVASKLPKSVISELAAKDGEHVLRVVDKGVPALLTSGQVLRVLKRVEQTLRAEQKDKRTCDISLRTAIKRYGGDKVMGYRRKAKAAQHE